MMQPSRRSFLSRSGLTASTLLGPALSRPLEAFAQAVGNAPKSSMPSNLKITDIHLGLR